MKVAILHDYLNQFGGAERVLSALLEIFPDADLYTLLYDKTKTFGLFEKNLKKTSFLDNRFVRNRHRAFIPLMPFAAAALKIDDGYDLIISNTASYAKGFTVQHQGENNNPYHVSYCLTPLRYAWEIDYLKNLAFSPWPLHKEVLHPIAKWLRRWDNKAAQRVNVFAADSQFVADKVLSYYKREASVIYPPVDTDIFYPDSKSTRKEYYLMIGRLLYYKGFDLGIKAFNRLKKPLKIVGSGPEAKKLKELADDRYIKFIPFLNDEELRQTYSDAKALIFPQIEDFGLVAAEAQTCGLPVIAFNQGGGREIVEHKKTGFLFNEQTVPGIMAAVGDFEHLTFHRDYIERRAQKFSKERFQKEFRELIRQIGFPI